VERLEALAEKIIADLDAFYGDPDLEPVNGSLEVGNFRSGHGLDQRHWADGGDQDEREPSEDPEPSLSFNEVIDQSSPRFHVGSNIDLEEEHDGREPDVDDEPSMGASEGPGGTEQWFSMGGAEGGEDEPSLGSLNNVVDQRRWSDHHDPKQWHVIDGEEQCEDEGGACEDEGFQCDDEGDAQATCQDFHHEGRRVWPPAGESPL
jgi:hypothetical protein